MCSWRHVRYIWRRCGLIGVYFTITYFIAIYVMLTSLNDFRQIEPENTGNVPILTTGPPTTPKQTITTIFPRKTYRNEIESYPMAFDVKSFVEDQIYSRNVSKYSDIDPINPRLFQYIYKSTKCKFDPKVENKLLILVKSASGNKDLRKTIRKTWANSYLDGKSVKLVFLVAVSDEEFQVYVDYEARKFKDIVQENFVDSYRNNTYKTIMAFNWAIQFCSDANYLLFIDDDHQVNIEDLRLHIGMLAQYPRNIIDNLYIGFLIPCGVPYREHTSKWYVPYEEYLHDYWPPYLAGGGFITSYMAALKFQLAIPYVQTVSIDDSYLGIVAKKVGIRPVDNVLYHTSGRYSNYGLFNHKRKSDDKPIRDTTKQNLGISLTSNSKVCFG